MVAHTIVDILLGEADWGTSPHGHAYASEPGAVKTDTGEGLVKFTLPPNSPELRGYAENERQVNQEGPIQFLQGDYGSWRLRYLGSSPGDECIGALQGVTRGRTHVASNIYVKPEYRGQGIAKRLMQVAKQWKGRLMISGSFTAPGAKFAGFSP